MIIGVLMQPITIYHRKYSLSTDEAFIKITVISKRLLYQ